MRTIYTMLMLAGLGLGFAGHANAEDSLPPSKPAVNKVPDVQDELAGMLAQMGYEVNVTESADKKSRRYGVKVSRQELGGEFEVSLSISPNKKKLWGHVYLAEIKEEQLSNSAALLKLLEENAKIGPNHFRVDEKNKSLHMSRCSDCRGLSPAIVKEHIENLLDSCVKTKGTWNVEKWGATQTNVKK